MPYDKNTGFKVRGFNYWVERFREEYNNRVAGASPLSETEFLGSNAYRIYQPVADALTLSENEAAGVFNDYVDYIPRDRVGLFNSPSSSVGFLQTLSQLGFVVSIRRNTTAAQNGELAIAVDTQDFDTDGQRVAELVVQYLFLGLVTVGRRVFNVNLSNGQSWAVNLSQSTPKAVQVRLTLKLKQNQPVVLYSLVHYRQQYYRNVLIRYRFGNVFEGEQYLTFDDAPELGAIKVEVAPKASSPTWQESNLTPSYEQKITLLEFDIEVIIT